MSAGRTSGSKNPLCVIGRYCAEHGYVHGAEAEELREKLEKLVAELQSDGEDIDGDGAAYSLQRLLDDVDARDSLAFVERRPGVHRKTRRRNA